MAVVTSSAKRLTNRLAIAAILIIAVAFLSPLYWIGSTAFKPRSLATTVPPTVFFQPEITPFIKLFTKRVQLTKPVDPAVYAAAPWYEQRIYDGGERMLRVGPNIQLSHYPNRFLNSLIIAIISTFVAVSMGTITVYGFVFQLFALYPHLTVYENIAFLLRATNESKVDVDRKVRAVARSLQIEHLLDKRPSSLAGGDMQRVAIGRALVRRPKAMLMDEPMGALDAKLREEMRTELKRLHLENEATTVYVTHDQVEAMSMADRIAIMNEGILQQVGTPEQVYHHPENLFVAQFVGSPVMNILAASVEPDGASACVRLDAADQGFLFPAALLPQIQAAGDGLTLGIRPEGVELRRDQAAGFAPVQVQLIEPLGAFDIVDLKLGPNSLRARTKSGFAGKIGDPLWVRLDPAQTHFFNAKTGESLYVRLGNGAN